MGACTFYRAGVWLCSNQRVGVAPRLLWGGWLAFGGFHERDNEGEGSHIGVALDIMSLTGLVVELSLPFIAVVEL